MVGEYCPFLTILEIKDCRDISEASLARLRLRGVKIDMEQAKWTNMPAGPNEYPERRDWRIPMVNLNIWVLQEKSVAITLVKGGSDNFVLMVASITWKLWEQVTYLTKFYIYF